MYDTGGTSLPINLFSQSSFFFFGMLSCLFLIEPSIVAPTDICADEMRHCHCCGTRKRPRNKQECNLPSRTCETIDTASAAA
ncbi:hypothetical protein LZ31DRAFT_557762 [Colletotrichum somersetense]|nr:hypothetical protein LZ31DRAFT_557762 [Colletotrichum somersetense]